jgi:integrase
MPKITDLEILKELVNAIYNYNGGYSLRNALKFVLHVPLRAENLCNLKWSYIDFEKNILTIPREEMKLKNINLEDFKMPLTNEVIAILNEQKQIQTKFTDLKEYVFLGTNHTDPINKESPNRALERLGFNDEKRGCKIRLHGFRGTFRSMIDTLDTKNKFSFDVKERALDHHEKNQVARAYNHKADYYEQLKPLMNYWSEYLIGIM